MTYIAEKPSVSSSAGGRQLITIEFAPDIHANTPTNILDSSSEIALNYATQV